LPSTSRVEAERVTAPSRRATSIFIMVRLY
jgi:hypothetical protein